MCIVERHQLDGAYFDFPMNLHWNEEGNRMVADAIADTALFKSVFAADSDERLAETKCINNKAWKWLDLFWTRNARRNSAS